MNYASIRLMDISNGEGIRTSLFVSGCTNNCPNCFNSELRDFGYGKEYTSDTEQLILNQLSKPYVAGLSILGGDPLCQDAEGEMKLITLITKARNLNKNIWLWTGFTWEDKFKTNPKNWMEELDFGLLASCDVVVDGPYIDSLKNLKLQWRGSSNQRIIDVEKTLNANKIILYKDGEYT